MLSLRTHSNHPSQSLSSHLYLIPSLPFLLFLIALPHIHALNITVPDTQIPVDTPIPVTVGFDTWKQPHRWADFRRPSGFSDVRPVCVNPPGRNVNRDGDGDGDGDRYDNENENGDDGRDGGESDDEGGCSYDELYSNYQIYLASTEWLLCYLTPILPIPQDSQTVTTNITISANLGPGGRSESYQLEVIEFNGDEMYMPYHGTSRTSPFSLQNSQIREWTTWEHYGGWVKPYRALPCEAYACFRECGLKWSDGKGNKPPGSGPMFFDCLNAECGKMGVRAAYDDHNSPWSWYKFTPALRGDDDDEDEGEKHLLPTSYATPTISIAPTIRQYAHDPDPTTIFATPVPDLDFVSDPRSLTRGNTNTPRPTGAGADTSKEKGSLKSSSTGGGSAVLSAVPGVGLVCISVGAVVAALTVLSGVA